MREALYNPSACSDLHEAVLYACDELEARGYDTEAEIPTDEDLTEAAEVGFRKARLNARRVHLKQVVDCLVDELAELFYGDSNDCARQRLRDPQRPGHGAGSLQLRSSG